MLAFSHTTFTLVYWKVYTGSRFRNIAFKSLKSRSFPGVLRFRPYCTGEVKGDLPRKERKGKKRKFQKKNNDSEKTCSGRHKVQWANIHLAPEEIGKKYVVSFGSKKGPESKHSKTREQFSVLEREQVEIPMPSTNVPLDLRETYGTRSVSVISDEEACSRKVTGKEFVTDRENDRVSAVRKRLEEQEQKYVPAEELLVGSAVVPSKRKVDHTSFPQEYEFAVIVNSIDATEKVKKGIEDILKRKVNAKNVFTSKFGWYYRIGIRATVNSLTEIRQVYEMMHQHEDVLFSFG
eukprot:jgi/Galph1/282/GphlegSOOS_G5117.1